MSENVSVTTAGLVDPNSNGASLGSVSVERRVELLARADAGEVIEMAERCLDVLDEPVVLAGPDVGTVMMQVREPVVRERFHIGEVVVTRVEVDLAGERGWAMRPGSDRVAALAAAVCDAAAADPRCTSDIDAFCGRIDELLAAEERHEWAELAATEVRFEELD